MNKTGLQVLPKVRLACLIALWVAPAILMNARAQEPPPLTNAISKPEFNLEWERKSIWKNGIGEGFQPEAQSISLSAGATYGFAALGGREGHDLALVSLTYGHMLGHVLGEGYWYRSNLEFRLELFTGAQFSPSSEWLVGLTPHLRYNFATGTRWIPFLDGGTGVTATWIGPPDLSGTFEFNLQAGAMVPEGERGLKSGSTLCPLVVCGPQQAQPWLKRCNRDARIIIFLLKRTNQT